MNKEKVKKALSKIGIASLVAGLALSASSVAKAGGTSCGKGSCGGAMKGKTGKTVEAGKTSCGTGAKMDAKTAKEETKDKAATEGKAKKKSKKGKSSCGAK